MGLGSLTLQGTSGSPTGPEREGPYIVERWTYKNADATRSNDLITCKYIARIQFVRGANQDTYGSSDPFTITNTTFPPTVTVNGVVTTEGGQIDIYGY